MKMSAKKVQELITNMVELEKKQSQWIDSLPMELREAFFDNQYTNNLRFQIDKLINFIFGDWTEDVGYFLYESAPHHITTNKKEYVINNVKEYVDYMVNEGFVTEDRY